MNDDPQRRIADEPLQALPEPFSRAMIVAEFRHAVRIKRRILEPFFVGLMSLARTYPEARDAMRVKTEAEVLDDILMPEGQERLARLQKEKAQYENSAATIVLLAVAEMERLKHALEIEPHTLGDDSYVPDIKFSQAFGILANQYKHLGEWRLKAGEGADAKPDPMRKARIRQQAEVVRLVDNAFRTDAAAEFMRRSNLADYSDLERRIMSCSDGLTHPTLVIDDEADLASFNWKG